jgi:hypothetical protein
MGCSAQGKGPEIKLNMEFFHERVGNILPDHTVSPQINSHLRDYLRSHTVWKFIHRSILRLKSLKLRTMLY